MKRSLSEVNQVNNKLRKQVLRYSQPCIKALAGYVSCLVDAAAAEGAVWEPCSRLLCNTFTFALPLV